MKTTITNITNFVSTSSRNGNGIFCSFINGRNIMVGNSFSWGKAEVEFEEPDL